MFPSILAYKYARAFLNTEKLVLSYDVIRQTEKAVLELQKQKDLFACFRIIQETKQDISKFITQILTHFKINKSFEKIVILIAKQKRLILIDQILQAIIELYKSDNKIVDCSVKSANEIQKEEKIKIENFVKDKMLTKAHANDFTPWMSKGTKKEIQEKNLKTNKFEIDYKIDKDLIAGIKIEMELLIWEKSVEKTMREIRGSLMRKYRGN